MDTIESWELDDVLPHPENMKKLCEYFHVPISYFHNYYAAYFDNPGEKLRFWKDKRNLTYEKLTKMLDISHSGLARLLNGRIKLSFDMYEKLSKLGVLKK